MIPSDIQLMTEVVAGPATGGALLAHTIAGLLDGRRSLSHPPCAFAPFQYDGGDIGLRPFYAASMRDRRVLLADDVRNTGKTFERCAALVREAGGEVVATVQIYDRLESVVDLGVPNIALIDYQAPENFPVVQCPLCQDGRPRSRDSEGDPRRPVRGVQRRGFGDGSGAVGAPRQPRSRRSRDRRLRRGGAGLRPCRQRDGLGRTGRRGHGRRAGPLRPRLRSAPRCARADADRPPLDPRRRPRRAVPGDAGDAARARIPRRRLRRRPRSRPRPTSGRPSTPSPRAPAPWTCGPPTARPSRPGPATATSSRARPAAAPASG